MPRTRVPPQDKLWRAWSYSKLRTLFTCPFLFTKRYIERERAPQPPIFAVGSALHYMVYRFFSVNYASSETFAAAWSGFWAKIIDGECGPNGFSSQPVEIDWGHEGQKGYWFGRGSEILRGFYERNADLRDAGIVRLRERRFTISWHGFKLTGIVDRVDLESDQALIIDYKMGGVAEYLRKSTLQATIYQIAYEELLKKSVSNKKLGGLFIENLQTGERLPMELRSSADKDKLFRVLSEASLLVESVIRERVHLDYFLDKASELGILPFRYIAKEHLESRSLPAKLPRDRHCMVCGFTDECMRLENDQWAPSPAERLIRAREEAERTAMPEQLTMY